MGDVHRGGISIEELPEKDYFGIYIPASDPTLWIAETDPLKAQLRTLARVSSCSCPLMSCPAPKKSPVILEFGVKFFVSDPSKLQHDHTRYLVYQQLKEVCSSCRLGACLF